MDANDKVYEHIVSLGHFCAVASELEKLGYREASLPFDWIITPFNSLIEMLSKDFKNFLKLENLERDPNNPNIVKDVRYNIAFYHDFKEKFTINAQHDTVKEKYDRRIKRFNAFISEKTLFIRYVETKNEYDFICDNYDEVMSILRKHNSDNDLLLISKDIKGGSLPLYTIYEGKSPYVTPQNFLKVNKKLYNTLLSIPYPIDKRKYNLKRYKKRLPKKALKAIKKLFKRFTKLFR